MVRYLMVPAIAIAMVAMMWSGAYAGDEFEDGFKYEMGAIAARATVGFGVGFVRGVAHGEPHRDNHVSRRHRRHRHCRHGYGPRYARTVVYRPYSVPVRRVERRVVYYTPGYRY
jgi:hypothetical protein